MLQGQKLVQILVGMNNIPHLTCIDYFHMLNPTSFFELEHIVQLPLVEVTNMLEHQWKVGLFIIELVE